MDSRGNPIVAETGEVNLVLMNIRGDDGFGHSGPQLCLGRAKLCQKKNRGSHGTRLNSQGTLRKDALFYRHTGG